MDESEKNSPKIPLNDITSFLTYLKCIISALLDGNEEEASSGLDKALQNNANLELFKKFVSDATVKCLLITKNQGNKFKKKSKFLSYDFSKKLFRSSRRGL